MALDGWRRNARLPALAWGDCRPDAALSQPAQQTSYEI